MISDNRFPVSLDNQFCIRIGRAEILFVSLEFSVFQNPSHHLTNAVTRGGVVAVRHFRQFHIGPPGWRKHRAIFLVFDTFVEFADIGFQLPNKFCGRIRKFSDTLFVQCAALA